MGTALKYLRDFFEKIGIELDKQSLRSGDLRRTATSLLILILILILLPVGLFLLRSDLKFFPRADGELIQLGEGGCIKLNKDKKKVVDCSTVPVKLVNPFYNITASLAPSKQPSSSPSVAASVGSSMAPSPSTSPSPTTPQVVRVTGNTNTEIKAAMDQVRTTGGAVYLPAGTYTINNKIEVSSNVTLFGDGIDQTILEAGVDIDEEEAVVGNSTSTGQNMVTIRDMTIRGHSLGSGEGIKLRNLNGGFVHNVKVERVNTGILLAFHSGVGVRNVRVSNCQVLNTVSHGIFMTLGENNVIDHCNMDAGGSDSLGIGLEIGVEGRIAGNKVLNNSVANGGHSYSLTAGNDNQYESSWVNTNNVVCYNSASGNHIQPIWDQRGTNNVYVGNNVGVSNVSSFGYEEKSGTDSRCDIPASYNIPALPAKPAADASSWLDLLIGKAFAQDSDDVFTGASGSPAASTTTVSPSPAGSVGGTGMVRYRLAESQAGLNSAQWRDFALVPLDRKLASDWLIKSVLAQDSDDNFTGTSGDDSDDVFTGASGSPTASVGGSSAPISSGNPTFSVGKQFITTNYQLVDITPGVKQIWVQFQHPDGTTRVDHMSVELVDKVPQITGLTCNLDISKQSLKITVDGNYFGTSIGSVATVSPASTTEIQGWTNKQIIASLKNPSISLEDGKRFTIKVVRSDGFESPTAICAVNKSLVSLGARIFCREPGKFDASDVAVTLYYGADSTGNTVSKVEEKVTISKDGEISQLKTQLQAGKSYVISIKAPGSLRRNATFTASEGTTQVTRPDGTPFILPVGDIAPVINVDGSINTIDRAELIRQWRVLGTASNKQSGDFNRDTKVNSIDWACMQYDFGSSDDPLPVEVPGSNSGTITIPNSASGTITIPKASPTPRPSTTSDNSLNEIYAKRLFS